MRDVLDELTEAYERLLPHIIGEHGHGWVVFASDDRVNKFGAFPDAARYARQQYGKKPVLIRHTDEKAVETAPFIEVRVEG